ncbi:hypothetical protein ABLO01_08920 [Mycobacterium tuberculosis]
MAWNIFFVLGSGGSARLVTPSWFCRPGSRDSLLCWLDAGFAVEER